MGRGSSKAGGRGGGRAQEQPIPNPEETARLAFRQNNGKELASFKSELKYWRDTEKEGDIDALDSDQHYWIIDKNGDEHFYQPGDGAYADAGIRLNKIAYVRNSNGDGFYDSNGVNSINADIERMTSDSGLLNRYEAEIERLYKTAWGRRN